MGAPSFPRSSCCTAAPVVYEEDVGEAASLVAGADVYLGNDAGMTHVAAALGVTTLAVFGPTDPHVWRPLGPRVSVIACGTRFEHLDAPELLRALPKPSPKRKRGNSSPDAPEGKGEAGGIRPLPPRCRNGVDSPYLPA